MSLAKQKFSEFNKKNGSLVNFLKFQIPLIFGEHRNMIHMMFRSYNNCYYSSSEPVTDEEDEF